MCCVIDIGPDRFLDRAPELYIRPHEYDVDGIAERLWAKTDDPDYEKIALRRHSWSAANRDRIVASIDLLMDELCERAGVRPMDLPPPVTDWLLLEGYGPSQPGAKSPAITLSSGSSNYSVVSWSGATNKDDPKEENWVDNDGFSKITPGLWIAPALRSQPPNESFPGAGDFEAAPIETVEDTVQSIPPSWKEVDLLSLDVGALNYCLNNPDHLRADAIAKDPEQEKQEMEDGICAQLITAFPFELVTKVLRENVSRNVEVLANLCAELI
ncbi:unnamed protein product, partial [Mesorhabditis spiculigera]